MCFVFPDEQMAMRHWLARLCSPSDLVFNRIDFLVSHSTAVPLYLSIQNVGIISPGIPSVFVVLKDYCVKFLAAFHVADTFAAIQTSVNSVYERQIGGKDNLWRLVDLPSPATHALDLHRVDDCPHPLSASAVLSQKRKCEMTVCDEIGILLLIACAALAQWIFLPFVRIGVTCGVAIAGVLGNLVFSIGLLQSRVSKIAVKGNRFVMIAALLGMSVPSVTAAAAVTVDLTTFKSGAGVRIRGVFNSRTGSSLSVIGDHNGDGVHDYIIGAYQKNTAIIVMKKDTTYAEMTTESIVSGKYYRVITGPANSDFGSSVSGIGDMNSDGYDDVIIAAPVGKVSDQYNVGYAVVIFGKKGPFSDVTVTDAWSASSVGFQMLGNNFDFGQLGGTPRASSGLGDVNGDGYDDFAISDRYNVGKSAKTQPGVVWVIFGKKKTASFPTIDLTPNKFVGKGVYYTGAESKMRLGWAVSAAGDFNGDGIADFLMGAPDASPTVDGVTRNNAGVAYLIHGSKTLSTTDLSTFVTGEMGVRFVGAKDAHLGLSLAGVGDINDDGLDDIGIGAPDGSALIGSNPRYGSGIVYVIYGTNISFTTDLDMKSFGSFAVGFAIYGRSWNMQLSAISPAGDINQDGVNDMIVGGYNANSNADIIYGQRGVRSAHVDTLTAGVTTFTFTDGGYFGREVDGGSDLNGDGIPDLLISAYWATITPEGGGTAIPNAGAMWMLPGPFNLATDSPSLAPSARPSRTPSLSPSLMPSKVPTVNPSRVPSVDPSAAPSAVDPTVAPTVFPSVNPSVIPTEVPSVEPSLVPTVTPSFAPSDNPSVGPSMQPTVNPSGAPSLSPSAVPTVSPSLVPSVGPTHYPINNPSTMPSLVPSVGPSTNPTFVPTESPFVAPTVSPSIVPTAGPTVSALKDFELSVNVVQDVYFIDKDKYDAQQAAYNKTIQHTVAEVIDGVVPDRVTDIVVEEEEEEGGRSSFRNHGVVALALSGSPVRLKYKITVFDPVYTIDSLRSSLMLAVSEGRMDVNLRFFAAQFGATGLTNATFALPQVTNAAVQRDSSSQLTGVMIALLVIGIVMALGLVAVWLGFGLRNHWRGFSQSPALPEVLNHTDDLVL